MVVKATIGTVYKNEERFELNYMCIRAPRFGYYLCLCWNQKLTNIKYTMLP